MKRPLALVTLLTLAAAPATARADEPAQMRQLFPLEVAVSVDEEGLSRLVLPVEVLRECRPDLSDLRLFDRDEREVAFLVDRGPQARTAIEVLQRFEASVVAAERAETARRHASPLRRESYEIGAPREEPQSGSWTLVLETARPEFVARVRVEALTPDAGAVTLVERGSWFRLRGTRPVENLRLELPPLAAERLRVQLETEGSSWLEPAFRLESSRRIERGGTLTVPLEIVSRARGGDKTVVSLERPRGIVPDLLRLETTTGSFDRNAQVWDEGTGAAAGLLGTANLFRVEALVPVEHRELELAPARGERLRVEIDDGDSPPLDQLTFVAVIRQPALIFRLPARGGGQAAGTLRFGGARAHLPRYDLAGLLPRGRVTGERARAAAALYETDALVAARLGEIRPNPDYDGAPALAFAMRPGAELDPGVFSHVRELRVPLAREGLSRVTLDASDLAVLADDLSDLRIADDSARQWPYLVEREAVARLVDLEVVGSERREARSHYELLPAVPRLRPYEILLDTDVAYFDRAFRLVVRDDAGEERTLASGRLVRRVGDSRPVSIDVAPSRVHSLELIVEDGGDAPLVFQSVQARIRCPEIYLTAPEGRYALLLGARDQRPARYELERVRNVVLAVEAEPIEVGALRKNPDSSLRARLEGRGLQQRVLLWVALIAAVLVLGGLTLRLARREA